MQEIKQLGLECFSEQIKGNKDIRNEKLLDLKKLITEKLGEDYMSYSLVNSSIYPDDNGKTMFPSITFTVKKDKSESTSSFAWRMMELFGINTLPFVSDYGSSANVVLDVTEYWKNMIIEPYGSSIKANAYAVDVDLIDLCSEIQFEQWCDWSQSVSEILSKCDITMQKVIEAYDNGMDMSAVLREQWESIGEVTKLLIKWNNMWMKSYQELDDEDKKVYKDYALKLINLYINWNFAHIVKV